MTDKEKIIAYIDKLLDKYPKNYYLLTVAEFIDSLQEEPVSEDLEKAALLCYPKMSRISEPHGIIPADNESHYICDANEENRKAFKAGAEWQKQQDQKTIELAEDQSAMLAGMEKMESLKKLADAMYNAAQNMTTDASQLRKAMDEYHQYVVQEYYD